MRRIGASKSLFSSLIRRFGQVLINFQIAAVIRKKYRRILFILFITNTLWFLLPDASVKRICDDGKDELAAYYVERRGRRNWPPKNRLEIMHPRFNLFDLTLRPRISHKSVKRQPWDSYYRILKVLHPEKHINGSYLKELYLMDEEQRDAGGNPDYDAYPQNLDMTKTVVAVKSGMAVDQPPINDPELLVINSPQLACNCSRKSFNYTRYPLDLVVLVKSCISCFERRNHSRSTYMQQHLWKGFRVHFAFVVGVPFLSDSDTFHFEGLDVSNSWIRLVSKAQVRKEFQKLQDESGVYNDLLVGGFRDTYYNLTLKLILSFRWASVFCEGQTPLFLFLDDDMSVIPANLIRFIRAISDSDKVFFNGGFFNGRMPVLRPLKDKRHNRWAVSDDEIPWRIYPPYSSGAGYMVGAEMIRDAAIAMAFTRYYRIDDVYLGIVWMKLKYPLTAIPGFRLSTRLDNFNGTLVSPAKALDRIMNWQNGTPKDVLSSLGNFVEPLRKWLFDGTN